MLSSVKLSESDQLTICRIHASGKSTIANLADQYNCSRPLIRKVLQAHGVKKGRKPQTEADRQAKLKKRRERYRVRYQSDKAYRERCREKARQEDPAKRRARQNLRYAENEEYRQYIADYGKQYRERKKEVNPSSTEVCS